MNRKFAKIGFIGCGKMAGAMIKGVLSSGGLGVNDIVASEVSQELANAKKTELGINVLTENAEVAKMSDVIFLAVKPHFVKEILNEIKQEVQNKLVVSIAAGISTKTIENEIGETAVIRVMPNIPAVIKEGVSGIVKGRFAEENDVNFVQDFLSGIGKYIVIEESQIDVLTAISSSGPAFFYKIIHETALAGEKSGLDYEKSKFLAIQTAIGSAKLMSSSNLNAQDLINTVATKGGCTQAGIDYMNEAGTNEIIFNLIEKTARKSKSLGN